VGQALDDDQSRTQRLLRGLRADLHPFIPTGISWSNNCYLKWVSRKKGLCTKEFSRELEREEMMEQQT